MTPNKEYTDYVVGVASVITMLIIALGFFIAGFITWAIGDLAITFGLLVSGLFMLMVAKGAMDENYARRLLVIVGFYDRDEQTLSDLEANAWSDT